MELRGLLSEEQRGEGMGEELSGEGLVNKYALLTKREVKTAGYWPSSLLLEFLRTETKSRSIKMQKRTTLISSHLDWTSLVNKGLIIHAAKRFSFIQNHECLSCFLFFFFFLTFICRFWRLHHRHCPRIMNFVSPLGNSVLSRWVHLCRSGSQSRLAIYIAHGRCQRYHNVYSWSAFRHRSIFRNSFLIDLFMAPYIKGLIHALA